MLSDTEQQVQLIPVMSAGVVVALICINSGIAYGENALYSIPYRYISHFGVVHFDQYIMADCDQ
jgi:hypothetical protein